MMNKLLLLLVFFISIINSQEINNGFNSSSYNIKSVNLLGVEATFLSGTLQFNEPLYLLESYSCSNFTCPQYNYTCPPCDFTHKGCSKPTPSGCPDVCTNATVLGFNEYKVCDQEWQDITLNQWTRGFVKGSVGTIANYYRFYAPDTCQGYKITIKTIQGEGKLGASPFAMDSTILQSRKAVLLKSHAELIICPNDTIISETNDGPSFSYIKGYPFGTIHMSVINFLEFVDLIYEFIVEPITVLPPSPTPPTCTRVDPLIPCLVDGQYGDYGPVDQHSFLMFSYTFNHCQNISIISNVFDQDFDFYVHTDANFDQNSNYTWSSSYQYDDILVLQLCPDKGKSSKTIYILTYCIYESILSFTLSTSGEFKLKELTSFDSVFSGTWALGGTSYLYNRKTMQSIKCDNVDILCDHYFPTFPRTENLPLYPVPNIFVRLGLLKFEGIAFNQSMENPASKNSFQYGLLLDLVINGIQNTYTLESDLENLEIRFLNRIMYGNGEAVDLVIPLGAKSSPECSYNGFLEIDSQIDKKINLLDTTSSSAVNGARYELNVLTYLDSYYSCKEMANSLIIINTTTVIENSKVCQAKSNTTENDSNSDPCCSQWARFGKCCRERPVGVVKKTFVDTIHDKVEDECSFPQCTNSILKTYAPSILGSEFDSCAISQDQESFYSDSLYTVFRKCKEPVLIQAFCKSDQDCLDYYGKPYKCNLRNDQCLLPYQDIELIYIKCIITDIPSPLKTEVLNYYNITTTDTQELIPILRNPFTSRDSTNPYGVRISTRRSYSYSSFLFDDLENIMGLDTSTGANRMDAFLTGEYLVRWIENTRLRLDPIRCDWLGEQGEEKGIRSDLKDECETNPPEYYCGDCIDPLRHCYTNLSISSQSECENRFVCYSPIQRDLYSWDFAPLPHSHDTIDPTECASASGVCSVPCGQVCSAPVNCIIPLTTFNHCFDQIIDGQAGSNSNYFDENDPYCTYSLEESICLSHGGKFSNCSSFTNSQCTICGNGPLDQCDVFGIQCSIVDIKCKSKSECEAAGQCSDQFYFAKQQNTYPVYQPKCFFERNHSTIFASSYPCCEVEEEQEFPYGCYKIQDRFLNQTYCQETGGKVWKDFAKTEQECNGYQPLCYGIDNSPGYLPPLTYRFNTKSQEDCECAGEKWTKPFTWTKGEWRDGNSQRLSWIKNKNTTTPITITDEMFDFEQFFQAFKKAAYVRTALLYKSEIMCRLSNSKNSLRVLSCGCSTDIGDDCFEDIKPPVLSIIKPCSDPPTNYTVLSNGLISFDRYSIKENFCISIGINLIFKDTYLSKKAIDLSSTFVSFEKPEDYSIYNEKQAVIGRVLNDGLSFDLFENGVYHFQLCLGATNQRSSKKFPHIDYALLEDNENGVVKPLLCDIHVDELSRFCCNITDFDQVVGHLLSKNLTINPTYILIERVDHVDKDLQVMSTGSLAMVFLLAIFYLMTAILAASCIVYFLYLKFAHLEPFRLVHLLFATLFIFALIRCIYFFLLPNTYLSSTDVTGYILSVLPVFLYFTAFTIVVVIWYILSADNYSPDIYKKIYTIILIINIVLYILFVVIVLVFNFTKNKIPPSCSGRILLGFSTNTSQKVVSFVYAVLQALVSLVIGVAFFYYGRKVYLKLIEIKGTKNKTKSQRRSTFSMAAICSTAFVLHSIFIIVLVSVAPSNIVFSFICLILTEIIPAMTLLLANHQFKFSLFKKDRAGKKIKMSNQKQNNGTGSGTGSGSGSSLSVNHTSDTSNITVSK